MGTFESNIKLNYQALAEVRRLMFLVQQAIDSGRLISGSYVEGRCGFDMRQYLSVHLCGTVACAAGWAEMAGVYKPDGPNSFGSKDIVVMNPDDLDVETLDQMFEWLFGSKWGRYGLANRPLDVVRRIDYLVTCNLDDESDFEFMWDMPSEYLVQADPGPLPSILEGQAVKSWTVDDLFTMEAKHRGVLPVCPK